MNDRSLACFAAAERTGSFSVAAWELSTTQQNVSYSIRKLEEELGFPLFVRRTNRVELTAGGEDFLAWYRAFDKAAASIAAAPDGVLPEGPVTDVQVRCFLKTAELENISMAADALFYSPPTLSGIIAALETALGGALFHRDKGRLTLTKLGQAYRTLFADAARSLAQVTERARRRYETARTTAVVGMSPWLDQNGELGRAIQRFDGNVTVLTMENQALLAALETGRVDMALWSGGHAPVNRGLDIVPIAEEDMCVFVPEDGRPCPIIVCPSWPRSYIENRVISNQETAFADFSPTGTALVDSLDRARQLLSGGGYAIVGDRRFGIFSDIPGLRPISLGVTTHIMACRRSNAGEDCAARLTDFLRAFFVGGTK